MRHLSSSVVLAAAVAQNKCTSIVCSCYAPSREQAATATATVATATNNNNSHELPSKDPISTQEVIGKPVESNDGSNSNRGSCTSNGKAAQGSSLNPLQEAPLKSNLKKTTIVEEPLVRDRKKKVSWPDAHGKDLAHVQEFQSSALEDGEIEGVRNSCICVIQ